MISCFYSHKVDNFDNLGYCPISHYTAKQIYLHFYLLTHGIPRNSFQSILGYNS